MAERAIVRRVRLRQQHRPTGKTRHYQGSDELPAPSELQIARYPLDSGYYLLYLDDEGNELTDTYHETLEGAVAQAEWEFQVKPDDWEELPRQ